MAYVNNIFSLGVCIYNWNTCAYAQVPKGLQKFVWQEVLCFLTGHQRLPGAGHPPLRFVQISPRALCGVEHAYLSTFCSVMKSKAYSSKLLRSWIDIMLWIF